MGLLKKGSKLYSIFHLKCPRCAEGDLFETPTFSFRKPFYMPQHCPKCGQPYFLEPGFYYGAMFISYIWTGWVSLIFVGILIWGFGVGVNTAFALLVLLMALLYVWIFRVSRAMWLAMNVKYDPHALDHPLPVKDQAAGTPQKV